MVYEKTIKRTDGSKVGFKVTCTLAIDIAVKGKLNGFNVLYTKSDDFLTSDELYAAKLEAWEKLKPVKPVKKT